MAQDPTGCCCKRAGFSDEGGTLGGVERWSSSRGQYGAVATRVCGGDVRVLTAVVAV